MKEVKHKKTVYLPADFEVGITSGQMIRELRERMGWSQKELAKRLKMAVTNLSRLENDQTNLGKLRAIAIAKVFKIHPATLMFPDYSLKDAA